MYEIVMLRTATARVLVWLTRWLNRFVLTVLRSGVSMTVSRIDRGTMLTPFCAAPWVVCVWRPC